MIIQNRPQRSWHRKEKVELKKNYGCIRVSDEDMKTFKTITDNLESTDDQEKPGKVFVSDDIDKFNDKKDE